MHEWRRQAALGFWSNIDAVQILIDAETEDFVEGKPLEQLSDLRWALEQVVPFASLKNGFEDRFVRSASPGDVKRFIDQGRYRKALGTVKNRLCPDAEMSAEEKQRQTIEAHRELQRRREVQGGVELKDPMMAWEISQIRHAAYLLEEIDAASESEGEPSDSWIEMAAHYAMEALERIDIEGISLPRKIDECIALLHRTLVKPAMPNKAGERIRWLCFPLPEYDECGRAYNLGLNGDDGSVDDVTHQISQADDNRKKLSRDGWEPLIDWSTPDHAQFDTKAGHAVALLLTAEEIFTQLKRIDLPGPYRPSKSTLKNHLHEIGRHAFEIGRHLQALEAADYVAPYRRQHQAEKRLREANPNKKGSMTADTRRVLDAMEGYVASGHSVKQAAALTHKTLKLGSSAKANRQLYYRHRKAGSKGT